MVEITYTMVLGSVSALGLVIRMWYPKDIPKNVRYFWVSVIITIVLVGIAFVYLNDKINSIGH